MTAKPKPKAKREVSQKLLSATRYKEMAERLAGCVIFAIKFLDTKDRGGLMVSFRAGKLGKMCRWQEDFFDALDLCGYKVDRKAYWDDYNKRLKTRTRRRA